MQAPNKIRKINFIITLIILAVLLITAFISAKVTLNWCMAAAYVLALQIGVNTLALIWCGFDRKSRHLAIDFFISLCFTLLIGFPICFGIGLMNFRV